MVVQLLFIRHGAIKSNIEKRYIGSTDEELCSEGIEGLSELWGNNNLNPDVIYSSPKKRCKQTTEIIFKDKDYIIVEGLAERHLGDFEGKIYDDIKDYESFRQFIESKGDCAIPNGEDGSSFAKRCNDSLDFIIKDMLGKGVKNSAIVLHGGVIMSIFSRFGGSFFDYLVDNGKGFLVEYDTNRGKLHILERL